MLAPHLDHGIPLTQAAAAAGVPLRTAQRWLHDYLAQGPAGLDRKPRADTGHRRLEPRLLTLIEGLALRKPAPTLANLHRQACAVAADQGWSQPSYSTVRAVVADLDPGLVTLAQRGAAAYRDRFELVYRRRAARPNQMWQADHTQLDITIVDHTGRPARPWLTVILDDHSRAVAGYTVFLGAPTALQTALALRQAVWRKTDPAWPVCGLPEVLYSDHGADFTSRHLDQVCHDTHIELIHSTAGAPQGRGKIERFFGTITTELLPNLPGFIAPGWHGKPATRPTLTLPQLDAAVGEFIVADYHQQVHSETGQPPVHSWTGQGWLPRMPDSLEQLDLLLLTVAKPRKVHRDGVHCHGLRYLDLTLSAYVGESVEIRYDPRDLAEIRVYHRGVFLCRAVAPDLAEQTITLKDLQAARAARRRQLRTDLNARRSLADDLTIGRQPIPPQARLTPRRPPPAPDPTPGPRKRLRTYETD